MSKLDEWRKLADRAWYDPCDQFQYAQKFGIALREACDRIEELEARLAKAEADRDLLRERSDAHGAEVERLCAKLKAADHVCEAAISVACEDGIRYQLLAYNMGLAMIQRLNDWTRLRLMKTG